MNRQIQIGGTPDDVAHIVKVVEGRGGVLVRTPVPGPAVETLPPFGGSEASLVTLAVRRADLALVRLDRLRDNQWHINAMTSPVLEILAAVQAPTRRLPGRVYCTTGYWADGHWVPHSREFLKWANGIMRWVRTHFVRAPDTGAYSHPRVGRSG